MKTTFFRLTACIAAVLALAAVITLACIVAPGRANAEEDVKYITGNIDITFDAKRLFLSEQLTGDDVTMAVKYAGITNFGYNYSEPNPEGWYVDSGVYYTCLVKVYEYAPNDPTYWNSLAYDVSPISKANKYYLKISIETYNGFLFDINHIPSIKVNGKTPDVIYPWNDGEFVDVFVPLEYHDDYVMITEAGPKYGLFSIQRGTSKQLIADIKGNDTSAVWSLVDAKSSETTITPGGLLTVGMDEGDYFKVRCASAVYPDIGGEAGINVTDQPVVVKDIVVYHDAKDGVAYRGQWVDFDSVVHGNELSDVVWSLQTPFNDPDSSMDEGGTIFIAHGETATSVTVRATSAFDSTKYGECTLEIKAPRKLSGTISITYDEDFAVLNDAYTGYDITCLLLDPEVSKLSHLDYKRSENGWFIDAVEYLTHLRKNTGSSEPYYWDRYYFTSEEPLDPDGEYYLVFEVENDIDAGYEWDMNNLPAFKVNGQDPYYVYKSSDDGGFCDVFVRFKTQKQRSVSLESISVAVPPTRTVYYPGDTFDTEGISVIAKYTDGKTSNISEKISFSPSAPLTAADKYVTISFVADGVTKTVQQPIQVVSPDDYYILTFNTMGGSYVPAQAVKKGDKPVRVADPVKKHLTLAHWLDLSSWDHLDFDKPLTGSVTARAIWVCTAYAEVYPKGSGLVTPRSYGAYAETSEYAPDEYEYSSGGFIAKANTGFVFKEWRLGSPEGEVIQPDEYKDYYVLRGNPTDVIFRATDGGYKFYAIFEPSGEVTPGPTDVPDVTADPATTDEPVVTDVPLTTDVPAVTAEPGTTDLPTVTAEPGTTDVPAVTAGPGATDVPAVTAGHGSATDPGVTGDPVKTAENSTSAPARADKGAGVPVWAVIVIVAAALGVGAGVMALVFKLRKKQ